MRLLKSWQIRPVYLLVTERIMSCITLRDMEEIGKNVDKIIKQRDDIVSQIYRTMFFLSTLLILVFLIEINLVAIPDTVWGVKLTISNSTKNEIEHLLPLERAPIPSQSPEGLVNNQDMFIFGFLLIGNIVALLFSSAMVMLEYVLKTYCWLTTDGASRYIVGITFRFYVFILA